MKLKRVTFIAVASIILVILYFFIPGGGITGLFVDEQYSCVDCNVVFIMIDTLRSDAVGVYDNKKELTPYIDSFASESVLFKNTVAASSWTRTSMASIFTGLHPKNHGAINKTSALSDQYRTMADIFKENGYGTYAFVANPSVTDKEGFDQGFDYTKYFDVSEGFRQYADGDEVNDFVIPFIKKVDGGKNFIYIHYMDPHSPYDPKERFYSKSNTREYDDEFFRSYVLLGGRTVYNDTANVSYVQEVVEDLYSLYADEVLFIDKKVKEVTDALKAQELYNNSIIVIMSDHGEEFFEHEGNLHSKTLHEEVLRVPFIMRIPNVGRRTIHRQVSHVDFFPTLFNIVGIEFSHSLDGMDIFGKKSSEYAYSELHVRHAKLYSIRSLEEKLILGTELVKELPIKWVGEQTVLPREGFFGKFPVTDFFRNQDIRVGFDQGLDDFTLVNLTQYLIVSETLLPEEEHIILTPLSPCRKVADLGRTWDDRCINFGVSHIAEAESREIFPRFGYYLLQEDPYGGTNFYYHPDHQNRVDQLEAILLRYIKEQNLFHEEGIDYSADQLEKLKTLGYI